MKGSSIARAPNLLDQVYDELRRIARARLANERPGHTLQATALVHEAYLKISSTPSVLQVDRPQFFARAAEAMRQILIDHARSKARQKRGGDGSSPARAALSIADVTDLAAAEDNSEQIMALDEAIGRLEQMDAQAAEVVKLRFFAGLSVEETAEALGVSDRTVKRDWQFARAWLFRELQAE